MHRGISRVCSSECLHMFLRCVCKSVRVWGVSGSDPADRENRLLQHCRSIMPAGRSPPLLLCCTPPGQNTVHSDQWRSQVCFVFFKKRGRSHQKDFLTFELSSSLRLQQFTALRRQRQQGEAAGVDPWVLPLSLQTGLFSADPDWRWDSTWSSVGIFLSCLII